MQKLLWGSFALAPVAIALKLLHVSPTILFPAGAVALVPLAWLVGEATDQTARHTGPALGALLNATFGNATELFISFFAIADAEFEVVRGSLSGSVVSNLLLVLGLTLLVGGSARLSRSSALLSLTLAVGAAALFLVPALGHWDGVPRTEPDPTRVFPVCAFLVVAYVAAMTYQVRLEAREEDGGGGAEWSLPLSLGLLGLGAGATGVLAEIVTSSIDKFAHSVGLSVFFVAAVLVALTGNAAEHGSAIVVAARGQVELGAEIALRSAAQVAAFLIPAVAMLSWILKPLPLAFRPVELGLLLAAPIAAALALADGRSGRVRGAALAAAYAVAVAAFFVFEG
jgi:Ca2+:H+ antiporter